LLAPKIACTPPEYRRHRRLAETRRVVVGDLSSALRCRRRLLHPHERVVVKLLWTTPSASMVISSIQLVEAVDHRADDLGFRIVGLTILTPASAATQHFVDLDLLVSRRR